MQLSAAPPRYTLTFLNANTFLQNLNIFHYFYLNCAMFFAAPPAHLKDKPIVCRNHANTILYVSVVNALSSMYAIYNGHYRCSILVAAVFLTSINYWRHPIYCWRRTLDVAVVLFSWSTMLIVALFSEHCLRYYILSAIAMSCYPISHYFANNNMPSMEVLFHSYLHILGNLALFVLFSGEIPHPSF